MTQRPAQVVSYLVADRAIGAVVGAVVGDAFGGPFEGRPGPIPEIDVVRHDEDRSPLRYSDDTALTLAVARWMLETAGADQDRLAAHLVDAYTADPNRGYGPGTARLLARVASGGDWRLLGGQAFDNRGSLGNGAAMRVAPIALAAAGDPAAAALLAARSAVITHTHPEGVDGAAVQAAATTLALTSPADRPLDRFWYLRTLAGIARTERLRRQLDAVGRLHPGSTASDIIAQVGNGVSAAESVPAAVACFLAYPDSFPAAVHFAVTIGGDTDTIASMTGAIAGARHGRHAIPLEWQERTDAAAQAAHVAAALAERFARPAP